MWTTLRSQVIFVEKKEKTRLLRALAKTSPDVCVRFVFVCLILRQFTIFRKMWTTLAQFFR